MSSTSQCILTTIASCSFSRNYNPAKIVTRQRTKWIPGTSLVEPLGPVLVSSGMYLDRRAILGRVLCDLLPRRAEITRVQGREWGGGGRVSGPDAGVLTAAVHG